MLWLLVSPKVGGKIIQGYWRVKAPSSDGPDGGFHKKTQAQVLGEDFGEDFGEGFEYKL